MTWAQKWEMGDPFEVCARRESMRNKIREDGMTQDQSEQIEMLIEIWYWWATKYRPKLGAPRVSVYSRGSESSDVHVDADEIDQRIAAEKAEQIDACLDALPWENRCAVDLHACNKAAGNKLVKNPRMSREQHHVEYQNAKSMLLPMLKKRGMIKDEK